MEYKYPFVKALYYASLDIYVYIYVCLYVCVVCVCIYTCAFESVLTPANFLDKYLQFS